MAEPPQSGRLRPDSLAGTVLLTALAAIGSFSVSIYTPSMPTLVADFDTAPAMVKLTLSLGRLRPGTCRIRALRGAASALLGFGQMALASHRDRSGCRLAAALGRLDERRHPAPRCHWPRQPFGADRRQVPGVTRAALPLLGQRAHRGAASTADHRAGADAAGQ